MDQLRWIHISQNRPEVPQTTSNPGRLVVSAGKFSSLWPHDDVTKKKHQTCPIFFPPGEHEYPKWPLEFRLILFKADENKCSQLSALRPFSVMSIFWQQASAATAIPNYDIQKSCLDWLASNCNWMKVFEHLHLLQDHLTFEIKRDNEWHRDRIWKSVSYNHLLRLKMSRALQILKKNVSKEFSKEFPPKKKNPLVAILTLTDSNRFKHLVNLVAPGIQRLPNPPTTHDATWDVTNAAPAVAYSVASATGRWRSTVGRPAGWVPPAAPTGHQEVVDI